MSHSTSPGMWGYWREKYGMVDALESYYPDLAKGDPILAAALVSVKIAELAIDARMKQLADAAESDDS